jgi:putative ATP-dependent endonuclease of the OLD family
MQIKAVTIKNFRSFSGEPQMLRLGNGINTIVGENNSGKTNILRAIELCLNTGASAQSADFFKDETDREIEISLLIELDDKSLKIFIKDFVNSPIFQKMESLQPRTITLQFSSYLGRSIRIPASWLTSTEKNKHGINIKTIVSFIHSTNQIEVEHRSKGGYEQNESLLFVSESNTFFYEEMKKYYRQFSEQRLCPTGKNTSVYESFDGTHLADVLSNLKNGDLGQRRKWELVQKRFSEVFPNLKVDVIKRGNEVPVISIEKEINNQELPISFNGSAVWEMLILITHLVCFEKIVFGIDTPELHFHPHIKRCLMNILKESSDKNQFIIVTHSTTFINPELIENIAVVREINGSSLIKQLELGVLDLEKKMKVIRLLDTHTKDLFFARGVLLVEGPTEYAAMPIFSRLYGKDLDTLGVSVIEMGGSDFDALIDVLQSFGFKYNIMCDRDAITTIVKSLDDKNKKIKVSRAFYNLGKRLEDKDIQELKDLQSKILLPTDQRRYETFSDECFEILRNIALRYNIYCLPTDFEGILEQNGYSELIDEAKKNTTSKVIMGRFIAEKIVEKKSVDKIPKEFLAVIDLITEKVNGCNSNKTL